jgi:rfaE bifunctional protein nucleotidyltransferase chain/domain
MQRQKLIPFDQCAAHFEELRRAGRKVVHCHGVFDLLHPGHLKHLAAARDEGDVLVVSITSAPYVNKGPNRPVFDDHQRAYQLAHLSIVDHVVVVPFPGAIEVIEQIRPSVYCKGLEYATPQNETDRKIQEDMAAVQRHGGEVRFVGEPLHSSSHLLGTYLGSVEPAVREYLERLPGEAHQHLDRLVEGTRKLKVLVVGELIVDRYTQCYIQGLTAKARVLSARYLREEDHGGGSLAIARHLASFGGSVRVLAQAGPEPWLDRLLDEVRADLPNLDLALLRAPDYQTILKERFVEQQGVRKDLIKMFAVNRLLDLPPRALQDRLLAALERELSEADVVVVCDYGHGMLGPEAQRLIERRAKFLALNVQTNSHNFGFNLITRYARCDLFSLDERELSLAFGTRGTSKFDLLARLAEQLGASLGWLTLGSSGSTVWRRGEEPHSCPAITKSTVDTVGAGDAFFAIAALCGRLEVPIELSSVLCNMAGGMAANIVGNKEPVRADALIKGTRYLLKSVGRGPERGG